MQIKNKYYPYPVIAFGNDSYDGAEFVADANITQDAHIIKFTLDACLNDAMLLDMVKDGKVQFAHHIECQQTCFRKLVLTDKESEVFAVHENLLNGSVQVCSFLMAAEEIQNYCNPSFSKDYHGFKFNLQKGCILAIGNQVNLTIDKDNQQLENTSSIFAIQKMKDPLVTELQVSTINQKIVISIPEKTCNQYLTISKGTLLPVLHAMVIQPALMQALYELKEAAQKNEIFNYEDYRWYRCLKKASEKLGIPFDEDAIAAMDVFSITQKLLDTPVVRALDVVCSGEEDFDD